MKTTMPISVFLYRAIQAQADLIDLLEEDSLVFDLPYEEPMNTATYYLFGMYWMSVADQKRIDNVQQIQLSENPATVLVALGYDGLPAHLRFVPEEVMGEVFADWYKEKSANVIEAFVEFIEMVEWVYPEELQYSDVLDHLHAVLAPVSLVYNIASEKPIFCKTNAIDRMFEESGLSSFYESDHQKQSRAILRFLTFWEKVDDAESRRKLLAVRSDDARIKEVKKIVTRHSPSIPLIKEEAAPYIALLRLGPLDEDRFDFEFDDADDLDFLD